MKLDAILVEKVSKNGNPYSAIEIKLTDKVKKLVFLNDSEIELIRLYSTSLEKEINDTFDI